MSTCVFFGHSDCALTNVNILKKTIEELIVQKKVCNFYVGNNGNFDLYVANVLKELKSIYPYINYCVVLAYLPTEKITLLHDTILPDGIETVPKKFAIDYRNRWLINRADYIVCYITRDFGGAVKYVKKAQRKKIRCINIADFKNS